MTLEFPVQPQLEDLVGQAIQRYGTLLVAKETGGGSKQERLRAYNLAAFATMLEQQYFYPEESSRGWRQRLEDKLGIEGLISPVLRGIDRVTQERHVWQYITELAQVAGTEDGPELLAFGLYAELTLPADMLAQAG